MNQDPRGRLHPPRLTILPLIIACVATFMGCSELRGRRRVREGNRLYRDGNFAEALNQYDAAEPFVPHLPQLWLGKGLACRQMMSPGSKTPENERAVNCALGAFDHLRSLGKGDQRGESLYIQTLFDAERFETLAALYGDRLKKDPSDLGAVNGQIQVYSRWNHLEEALAAYQKRADMKPNDAEAQYAVGVYIWQQLFQRGGGPDKASYDPRPDPNAPATAAATEPAPGKGKGKGKKGKRARGKKVAPAVAIKQPPPFTMGDITGTQRVALSDLAMKYLERALALRPKYREAMIYMNLVLRQKSLAYLTNPTEWQACIDAAEKWRAKAEADAPHPKPEGDAKAKPDGQASDGKAGADGKAAKGGSSSR
jgi:tetratricopeptide (TPR) repeat protein